MYICTKLKYFKKSMLRVWFSHSNEHDISLFALVCFAFWHFAWICLAFCIVRYCFPNERSRFADGTSVCRAPRQLANHGHPNLHQHCLWGYSGNLVILTELFLFHIEYLDQQHVVCSNSCAILTILTRLCELHTSPFDKTTEKPLVITQCLGRGFSKTALYNATTAWKQLWRCLDLNPGPLTCEASALPLSYIPKA